MCCLPYLGLVCLLLLELPDDVALLLDGLRLGHLRWGHGRRVGGRRHTSVRIHPLHLEGIHEYSDSLNLRCFVIF